METLTNLSLHKSWTVEEAKYLRKRLGDLVKLSKVIDGGCIVHKKYDPKIAYHTFNSIPYNIGCLSTYRFVAFCLYGRLESSVFACHLCDVKGCHNPTHFRLGDSRSNALDKFRDGTMTKATLTETEVLEIFRSTESASVLALKFDLTQRSIERIKLGETWSAITGMVPPPSIKPTREIVSAHILSESDFYWRKIRDTVIDDIESECFEWDGSTLDGYGLLVVMGVGFKVHIITWSILEGRFPEEGEVVRHKVCDNKICCNPEHLLIGSHSDNMKDRNMVGEAASGSRLTESQVREISERLKVEGAIQPIAKKYNVGEWCISSIRDGTTWKHLNLDISAMTRPARPKHVKLTESQVLEIAELLKGQNTVTVIANRYNVSYAAILDIRDGKTWKHLKLDTSAFGFTRRSKTVAALAAVAL